MAADKRVNIHGRKGGRGIRPWLLIPKYLCVSVYFGSLVAMAALASGTSPATHEQWVAWAGALRTILRGAAFPALTGAVVVGVLLWVQHPSVFVRMRWWQVKMGLLVLGLPVCDWLMDRHLTWIIRADPMANSAYPLEGLAQLPWGGTIVVTVLAVILGRLKPRLGQRVKTLAEQREQREGATS